jgi:hypothetical protein
MSYLDLTRSNLFWPNLSKFLHAMVQTSQSSSSSSMGLENPKSVIYPPLPPPAVEDPWAWYRNANDDDEDYDNAEDEI